MMIQLVAPVAQLDRAPDFESVGREFESPQARHYLVFYNDLTLPPQRK